MNHAVRFPVLLGLLATLLVAASAGSSQTEPQLGNERRGSGNASRVDHGHVEHGRGDAGHLAHARERWQKMSPEERQRLRGTFEQFRSMSADERRMVSDRARVFSERRDRILAELPSESRQKLDSMTTETRRLTISRMLEREMRDVGQRVREKMPEDWMQRMQKLDPSEREHFVARVRECTREKVSHVALNRIGKTLGIDAEELQRYHALPPDERSTKVLELSKRLSAQDFESMGAPPGCTVEQWQKMLDLSPERFFEEFQRRRSEHGWPEHDRRGDGRGPNRDKEQGDARNADRGPRAGSMTPEKRRAFMKLLDVQRPTNVDIIDFAEATPDEFQRGVQARRRQRCLKIITDAELLPPERIAELAQVPPELFQNELKRLLPAGPDRGRRSGRGDTSDGTPQPPRDDRR